MANDNETVNEIRAEVGEYLTSIGPSELPSETQVEEFADRFASAHEREMNAIAAQKTAEAHEAFVKNAELAEAIEAKDAEIENLKKENARLRVIVSGATVADGNLREEIERLREIVKELADELETMICNEIVKSSKRHGK